MKNIILQEKFAYLYFPKRFYSLEALENSLQTYNEFIESQTSSIGNYHVIKISLKDEDFTLEEVAKELSNYIIATEYQITNNA